VFERNRQQRAQDRERLEQENERLRRELADRERELDEAQKQIADAKKRIAELERQLALREQNSTTTSKPPSSDGLAGRQRLRGRRTKSRRRRGGQRGHPGHRRALVPPERLNAVVDLVPTACDHCQRALNEPHTVGTPHRHQVTELPSIEAHVTEYRRYERACPDCGRTTRARLPQDVVGQFGPHLTGVIAYLTVVCRLPRTVVRQVLQGVLQIPISVGCSGPPYLRRFPPSDPTLV
jgi:hypothetical protein